MWSLEIQVLLWNISHNSKAHSDKFSVSSSSVTRTVPVQYLEGISECWSMYLISDYHNHHGLNYSDKTFPWGPQSGRPLVNHVLWSLPGHRAARDFFFCIPQCLKKSYQWKMRSKVKEVSMLLCSHSENTFTLWLLIIWTHDSQLKVKAGQVSAVRVLKACEMDFKTLDSLNFCDGEW